MHLLLFGQSQAFHGGDRGAGTRKSCRLAWSPRMSNKRLLRWTVYTRQAVIPGHQTQGNQPVKQCERGGCLIASLKCSDLLHGTAQQPGERQD